MKRLWLKVLFSILVLVSPAWSQVMYGPINFSSSIAGVVYGPTSFLPQADTLVLTLSSINATYTGGIAVNLEVSPTANGPWTRCAFTNITPNQTNTVTCSPQGSQYFRVNWWFGGVGAITLPTTLSGPVGAVIDQSNDIFIADTGNNRILEYVPGASTLTTVNLGGLTVNGPTYLALDSSNNLYISDSGNKRVIKWTSPNTASVWSWGAGITPNGVSGITIDSNNFLFTCDNADRFLIYSGSSGGGTLIPLPVGASCNGLGSGTAGTVYEVSSSTNQVFSYCCGNNGTYTSYTLPGALSFNKPDTMDLDETVYGLVTNSGANNVLSYGASQWSLFPFFGGIGQLTVNAPRQIYCNKSTYNCVIADTGNNRIIEFPAVTNISGYLIGGIFGYNSQLATVPKNNPVFTGTVTAPTLNLHTFAQTDVGLQAFYATMCATTTTVNSFCDTPVTYPKPEPDNNYLLSCTHNMNSLAGGNISYYSVSMTGATLRLTNVNSNGIAAGGSAACLLIHF